MIIASFLLAFAQGSDSEPVKRIDTTVVSQSMLFYRNCITEAAKKMDRSGEQASLIADIAISSCHSARAMAKALSVQWLQESYPTIDRSSIDEAAEKSLNKSESDYRSEALAAVLTQRAARK